MKRRAMLKTLMAAGAAASGFRLPLVDAADYRGKLFVFVQADGGWDPTSFCDPKANTPGEPVINHWAESDEVHQIGRIRYAPFARNEAFFRKYHRRMLIINGVDAQTNSHTVGIVHNWSGRNSEGYPTTTALLAAHFAPELPVPYLSFGGFSATGGVTRFTRIDDANLLREVANPATRMFSDADWAEIDSLRNTTAQRLETAPNLLPGDVRHRGFYRSAFATEGLKAYADAIPFGDELEQDQVYDGEDRIFYSRLRRQAQLTVLAFKTGVAVSADLWLGGFDTHAYHDPDHEWLMANLTDSVDYLWEYAEEHGVANRMVVVIGSDFGRTNFYNSADGKDHWPIGSFILMEKNQPWTGRAVGETDGLHFAQRINPAHVAPRRQERDYHLPEARAQGAAALPRHRAYTGGATLSLQQHRGLRVLRLTAQTARPP